MKKKTRIILLIVGIPFSIYIFLAQLDILKLYSNPSTANEPALKLNSKILVSNLVSPKIGDFVCFKFYNEELGLGDFIKVNRLCALENDTVEIKNGVLFLNNKNFDKHLNLMFNYKIPSEVFEKLKNDGSINEELTVGKFSEETYIVSLDNDMAKRYNLLKNRIIDTDVSKAVKKTFNENWNKDNFGPLIIPKNKFFVLGDNRDNSFDSRFVGLIDKNQVVGVVVKIF